MRDSTDAMAVLDIGDLLLFFPRWKRFGDRLNPAIDATRGGLAQLSGRGGGVEVVLGC